MPVPYGTKGSELSIRNHILKLQKEYGWTDAALLSFLIDYLDDAQLHDIHDCQVLLEYLCTCDGEPDQPALMPRD